jgi:hypothetical protein
MVHHLCVIQLISTFDKYNGDNIPLTPTYQLHLDGSKNPLVVDYSAT